jgi:hypothetical protein
VGGEEARREGGSHLNPSLPGFKTDERRLEEEAGAFFVTNPIHVVKLEMVL